MKAIPIVFALALSVAMTCSAQQRETCKNLTDSAINEYQGRYLESMKRKNRLDSLSFLFELPNGVKVSQAKNWCDEHGARCWTNRGKSIVGTDSDSADFVVLKLPVKNSGQYTFSALFADVIALRQKMKIEHCGIYTHYQLQNLTPTLGSGK